MNPDDVPTGQIAAAGIAQIIAEADGTDTCGTETAQTASEPDVQPVIATAAPADLEQALADRRSLIQLCLYAMDRARSGGVVERIEHGLAEIGVRALRPDGDRFDPALHEAGGATPTDDEALAGTVAETEVVGFADHDKLLRAPIVTVYTKRP
ncbi:nucleotide exchange factor GrpE [Amycolatopsis sp. NPDC059657]|uniref:nucleotide exchange factor GrpE n=1 Tax=Amycolatopsis sp. NPDC059657 TaxID=3346899 RepID=UPI00366ED868